MKLSTLGLSFGVIVVLALFLGGCATSNFTYFKDDVEITKEAYEKKEAQCKNYGQARCNSLDDIEGPCVVRHREICLGDDGYHKEEKK